MANKINYEDFIFELTPEQLKSIINKINDLTDIKDKIILKFDPQNLLMYSFDAKERTINAFKSHILEISKSFTKCEKLKSLVKFIIGDGKKTAKNLDIFLSFDENIHFKVIYDEEGVSEKIMIKNSKLKFDLTGDLASRIKQDIDIDTIKQYMDIKNSLYSFELTEEDFLKIKKMSTIEKDNEIYRLLVKENKVFIGENHWNLLIGNTNYSDNDIAFPKKYFNTINFEDEKVIVYIFETFILYIGKESNLMFSIEISI